MATIDAPRFSPADGTQPFVVVVVIVIIDSPIESFRGDTLLAKTLVLAGEEHDRGDTITANHTGLTACRVLVRGS